MSIAEKHTKTLHAGDEDVDSLGTVLLSLEEENVKMAMR
jgi:hypothetical protein